MDDFAYYPQVIRIWPSMNSPSTGPTCPIIIDWTMEMDGDEFLYDVIQKKVRLYEDLTGTSVPLSGFCTRKRTTFIPLENLKAGETYHILLESGLKAANGRGMRSSQEGLFVVSGSVAEAPILLSPADGTSYSQVPELRWSDSTTEGITGTVNYWIEIDDSPAFISPAWSTVTSATSALPSINDSVGKTWFWRVTPMFVVEGASVSGETSFPSAFYISDRQRPSVTTQSQWGYSSSFEVNQSGFDDGLSNQGAFPQMIFDFNFNLSPSASAYITVSRSHVDGRVDQPSTFYEKSVAFTSEISSGRVTITITESANPYDNNRYVIRFLEGLPSEDSTYVLTEPLAYEFTGHYQPYYCNSSSVNADFGDLLRSVPEDLINFHIYKASLDAQANWMSSYRMFFMPLIGGAFSWLPESIVRDSNHSISYAIHKWTELEAARRILRMFMMEHARLIGSSRKLGDLSEEWNADALKLTTSILDDIKHEKIYWEQFLNPTPLPRTTTKSSQWLPFLRSFDRSGAKRRDF